MLSRSAGGPRAEINSRKYGTGLRAGLIRYSLRLWICVSPQLHLRYNSSSKTEDVMKAFAAACIATIALAVIGLVVLNHVQEPADEAFATSFARVG